MDQNLTDAVDPITGEPKCPHCEAVGMPQRPGLAPRRPATGPAVVMWSCGTEYRPDHRLGRSDQRAASRPDARIRLQPRAGQGPEGGADVGLPQRVPVRDHDRRRDADDPVPTARGGTSVSVRSEIHVTDRKGTTLSVVVEDGQMMGTVNPPGKLLELDETDRARLRDFLTVNS